MLRQALSIWPLTVSWIPFPLSSRRSPLKRAHLQRAILAGFGVLFALLSMLLHSVPMEAVPISEVSDPRATGSWVTDSVGILNDSVKAELNTRISDLEAANTDEIVVVVVRDTQPASTPRDYALKMFNTWGLGKAAQNNGVLLLISTGDRRVEIITGDGLGQRLPDAHVQDIVDRVIIPRFKQEDYGGGALQGTVAVIDALTDIAPSSAPSTSGPLSLLPRQLTQPSQDERGWPALVTLIESVGLYVAAAFAIAAATYLGAVRLSRRTVLVSVDGRPRKLANLRWLIYILLALGALAVTFNMGLFVFTPIALFGSPFLIIPAFLVLSIGIGIIQLKSVMRVHTDKYKDTSLVMAYFGAIIGFGLTTTVALIVTGFGVVVANGVGLISSPLEMSAGEWVVLGAIAFALANGISLFGWVVNEFFIDSKLKRILPNIHCDRCRNPLTLINDESLNSLLTEPEQTAKSLGSVAFEGWQCASCSPVLSRDGTYLLRQVLNRYKYDRCPACAELTVTSKTEVLSAATYSSSGSKKVTQNCHCCGSEQERMVIIPRKVRSSSSSRSSSSRSSRSSSRGGSSSGGGGGGSW